jgi:hypothetical protein
MTGLAIMWLPHKTADALDFIYLRNNYLHWISVGTFVCLGVALSGYAKSIGDWWRERQAVEKAKWRFMLHLDSLSAQERLILAYCLSRNTTTILLSAIDGPAASLCSKGFLYKWLGTGHILAWPYIIPEHVWAFISVRPDSVLLGVDLASLESQFQRIENSSRRLAI